MRYLEEWLDEYVKGIALVSARTVEGMDMVTEDNRKERGDYDEFFKIKKKEHHGTLEERMVNLEQDLNDYQELLEVFVQALDQSRLGDARRLGQRWKQLHDERPWAGGVIVAKAWTDPEFKQALLDTGREALREMGVHQGKVGKLLVVENSDKTHNVIVCTSMFLLSLRHPRRHPLVVQARKLPHQHRAKPARLREGDVSARTSER